MRLKVLFLVFSITYMSSATRKAPGPDEPVIVVGGGLAGLSATIEAIEAGAKVVLVERESNTGGNSAKASSGINACGTNAQKNLGITDTSDLFYSDTLKAGDRKNNADLVDVLVHSSSSAIDFLESNGIDLGDVNLCAGHTVPRTHWIPSPKTGKPIPVGFEIMRKLRARIDKIKAERPDDLVIMNGTTMIGLSSWNEYLTGINVKTADGKFAEINGKAVILATGGYSADRAEDSLLHEFAPNAVNLPTTNGAFARGDGVKFARAMGAAMVDMNDVQVHPTAFVDPADPTAKTKFLAAEALRGKGAMLINMKGTRFANELGRRDYLTNAIFSDCKPIDKFQGGSGGLKAAIMLMNEKAAETFGLPAFNFYANIKKFFVKYANIKEFAQASEIEQATLENTFKKYNEDAKNGRDSFSKSVFPVIFNVDEPLFAAIITPALHYTMGGLKIDDKARVFDELRSKPCQGLFAAGEVAGGVHGSNRLAGNSLLECVVFGRIAGRQAAATKYNTATKQPPATKPSNARQEL